jgi:predicted esterase
MDGGVFCFLEQNMSTFSQFSGKFFELYGQGAYTEALSLVDDAFAQFPEHRVEMITWKLCMLSRAGQLEKAIETLRDAVETSSYWWMPDGLRKDPDLAPLQGNPAYEQLVAVCEARQQAAAQNNRPERLVFQPKKGSSEPYPLLISFHGWGQNAEVNAPHWQGLADQGWLVAVTRSSLEVADGMFTWDNLERGVDEAKTHYEALCREFPVDSNRVVLGGFSHGGGLAVWLALTQAIQVCGVVGVGPYLNAIDTLAPTLPQKPIPNVRFYVISGAEENDEGMFAKIGALCAEKGIPFQHEVVPGIGHEFPANFEQFVKRALKFVLE